MERPSHINLRTSHTVSSRLVSLGLAVSLLVLLFWALAYGMMGEAIKQFSPIIMARVADHVKPQTPPPPLPVLQTVKPVIVEQPMITIAPPPDSGAITPTPTVPTTPTSSRVETPPLAGPDKPASSIMATHTSPPYPVLAQRLGEQGNVTLRLTVQVDGKVGKADVVTSSGSNDLDASAQEWIVSHWRYRPALDKGQPVASKTVVTVTFNLNDQQ